MLRLWIVLFYSLMYSVPAVGYVLPGCYVNPLTGGSCDQGGGFTESESWWLYSVHLSTLYRNSNVDDSFATTVSNDSSNAQIKDESSRLFYNLSLGITLPSYNVRCAVSYLNYSTKSKETAQVSGVSSSSNIEESLVTSLSGIGLSVGISFSNLFFEVTYYPKTEREQNYEETSSTEELSYSFKEAGGTAYSANVGFLINFGWISLGPEFFYLKRQYKERHYTIENTDGTKSESKVSGSYSESEIIPQLGFHYSL